MHQLVTEGHQAIDNDKDWKPYQYKMDTKLVDFIGKDNIVFHAIFPDVETVRQYFT
jgi:methionyl-tRNA synthetase